MKIPNDTTTVLSEKEHEMSEIQKSFELRFKPYCFDSFGITIEQPPRYVNYMIQAYFVAFEQGWIAATTATHTQNTKK